MIQRARLMFMSLREQHHVSTRFLYKGPVPISYVLSLFHMFHKSPKASKVLTGEPCAGDPHARFGGRGGANQCAIPTSISGFAASAKG